MFKSVILKGKRLDCYAFSRSDTDSVLTDGQWLFKCVISVSSDEILEQEFRISEIRCIILERLSVRSHESLLEISSEPDPLLHLVTS
jgi:hypothetical protein